MQTDIKDKVSGKTLDGSEKATILPYQKNILIVLVFNKGKK